MLVSRRRLYGRSIHPKWKSSLFLSWLTCRSLSSKSKLTLSSYLFSTGLLTLVYHHRKQRSCSLILWDSLRGVVLEVRMKPMRHNLCLPITTQLNAAFVVFETEPAHVFELLERIYCSFDVIAKKKRIFKVRAGKLL